ncbi:hypothetical protein [Anaerophilus nitritogenes]|uniref:hypothetical protein n=1 Tax=Anaerophilus nitritogenes TaxID=2498136 RepID=UPI00101CDEB4|nr:hypothetical protein [Anaerophilus nitritogenes]
MGFAKYIINIDELFEKFNIEVNANMEDFKDYLEGKLDAIIDLLKQNLSKKKGIQSIKSMSKSIPAIVNDFILEYTFSENVMLTGITYSQSAWKAEDNLSVLINGSVLFDHVYTKELGEYKHFHAVYYFPANTTITIIHHNHSGNSKLMWVDIEFVKLFEENNVDPPIEEPSEPEPDDEDENICKREFEKASTVQEAIDFARNCLGIVPRNYEISLEWANHINEGTHQLFREYPSVRDIVQNSEYELVFVLYEKAPENNGYVGGYFQPPTSQNNYKMIIGVNTHYTVQKSTKMWEQSFLSGFNASGHKFATIYHEVGHYCHFNNVSIDRWIELTQYDPDGYGVEKSPQLTPTLESIISQQISTYATYWYPIEFVAEYFAVYTLREKRNGTQGYDHPTLRNKYNVNNGFRPNELT